jgi:uncharacterized phiE125 gp8 family phage protein
VSSIEYQTLRVSTPPAVEPVTLTEAKSHLRVDSTADDAYVSTLVTAAREWIEQYLDRALIRQQLVMTLKSFPVADDEIVLPRPPMATEGASTAVSVAYTLASGATATLSTSQYRVDRHRTPGEVQTLYGATWPADRMEDENSVTVTWWAGYGASGSSVPAAIRHAILMLVGHWYDGARSGVVMGSISKEVEFGVKSLLDSQRWGSYR